MNDDKRQHAQSTSSMGSDATGTGDAVLDPAPDPDAAARLVFAFAAPALRLELASFRCCLSQKSLNASSASETCALLGRSAILHRTRQPS